MSGSLLHRCLRARWDPAALAAARRQVAQETVDWEALLREARQGGVTPLLYDVARGQDLFPPPVEDALRLEYYGNARRNALAMRQLEQALRRLAAAGVPVIVLKGAALAQALYGNVALRPMDDLDLLVPEQDVSTALRVLSRLGYQYPVAEPGVGYHRRFWNEVTLTRSGEMQAPFEVHWRLFGHIYYKYAVPVDWFWQTAQPLRIGDTVASMLSPEAQVIHLCGHIALQHHSATRLMWLHDLAELVVSWGDRIDWDRVMDRAQAYDLVLATQGVLSQVREGWHLPVSSCAWERLAALRPSSAEGRFQELLTGTARPVARYLSSLKRIPDWGTRLFYIWYTLFPSTEFMRDRYRVPHSLLLALYYPYRWLRALRRVGRG